METWTLRTEGDTEHGKAVIVLTEEEARALIAYLDRLRAGNR